MILVSCFSKHIDLFLKKKAVWKGLGPVLNYIYTPCSSRRLNILSQTKSIDFEGLTMLCTLIMIDRNCTKNWQSESASMQEPIYYRLGIGICFWWSGLFHLLHAWCRENGCNEYIGFLWVTLWGQLSPRTAHCCPTSRGHGENLLGVQHLVMVQMWN